jgi:PPM family protein phosphatase
MVATGTFRHRGLRRCGEHVAGGARGPLSHPVQKTETTSPVVGVVDFQPGDALLLCSDGLTKHENDGEIAVAPAQQVDAETTTRGLVNEALANGGTENVTVIVARM